VFCFRSYIVVSAIGSADDFDDRDGNLILDFWQAQEKARAIGHRERGSAAERPATVAETTDRYEADLRARQGDWECHAFAGASERAVERQGRGPADCAGFEGVARRPDETNARTENG
jgi:hypothetical protein